MESETMRPEMRRISIGLVTSVSTSGHHQISSKQCSSRPKHFIIHLHTVIQDNFTFYTLLMQHRDTLALEVNVQQQECLVFLLFCVNVCFYLAIKPKIVKENEVNPWIFKLLWRFIIFLTKKNWFLILLFARLALIWCEWWWWHSVVDPHGDRNAGN